jgi:hypothetical protein
MCRLWGVAECNVTVGQWFLNVDLKTMSTATTKSHCLTEVKVVARILLHPSHPSNSARRVIMEEKFAKELTDKSRAVLPNSLRVARLQAH